ncbi:hypothetical protein GCM10027176_72150 [Actinoallomurus bryophytorum]|uniref:Thioredoxin domain-containing protein n=1 Tax=Actinoallomurus bryophytorum TaxID=1490222 RepID=A0A543CRX6_9ACTN|nr:hypothetical protein [Actinoallomurus bryophytorum]TQL99834.1 hypothetical protein FB559_5535 [Actinoallomurus bryophytorum]
MSFDTTALLLTWAALVLLALVVAGLVRQVHHLTQGPRTRDLGLRAGTPAPAPDLVRAEPGQPTLLLFLSEDCPACRDIFQEALGLDGAPATRAIFAEEAIEADPPPNLTILARQSELFTAYQVPATPYGVVIGADGRVRTAEPVGSVRALHTLVTDAGGRLNDDAELDRSTR